MGKFFKVKIVSCADQYYWYADKIGDVIDVKKTTWDGWGYEARNGASVFRHDVEVIEGDN